MSQFGHCPLLTGQICSEWYGSTPQTEAADSSVRSDDKSDVGDRMAQFQLHLAIVMNVMRAELQRGRRR